MKIRSGFVSNSSSSSFVILGARIDKLNLSEEKMKEALDKYEIEYGEYIKDDFYDALYGEEFDFDFISEPSIIGKYITVGKDYGLGQSNTSFKELTKIAKKVKKDIKDTLDIDIDVELLTGEMVC